MILYSKLSLSKMNDESETGLQRERCFEKEQSTIRDILIKDFSFINDQAIQKQDASLEDSSEIYRCYIKEITFRRHLRNNDQSCQGSLHLLTQKSEYELSFDRPYDAKAEIPLKLIYDHYQRAKTPTTPLRDTKRTLKQEISTILQHQHDFTAVQTKRTLQTPKPQVDAPETHYKMEDFSISINLRKNNHNLSLTPSTQRSTLTTQQSIQGPTKKATVPQFNQRFTQNQNITPSKSPKTVPIAERSQLWLRQRSEKQSKRKEERAQALVQGCTFQPVLKSKRSQISSQQSTQRSPLSQLNR